MEFPIASSKTAARFTKMVFGSEADQVRKRADLSLGALCRRPETSTKAGNSFSTSACRKICIPYFRPNDASNLGTSTSRPLPLKGLRVLNGQTMLQKRPNDASSHKDYSLCGQGKCWAARNGIDLWAYPQYSTKMNTRLVIDKAGRVVIPKRLREELHLEPGDALEMESAGEQITLRPVRGTGPLTKEHGVWVFHSGQAIPASVTDEILQQIREERDLANLGKGE